MRSPVLIMFVLPHNGCWKRGEDRGSSCPLLFYATWSIGWRCSTPRRQGHLAKLDRPMIALEQDGARLALVAVECSARDAGDRLPVDDALAVESHRDHPADEGDLHALPLAGFLAGVDGRREKAVD